MPREKETPCSLRAKGWFPQPDGSWSKTPPRDLPPAPVSQPAPEYAPDAAPEGEAFYPGRVLIRITSYRCGQLCDPDNTVEKFHVDCLRKSRIISGDEYSIVEITNSQEKVGTRSEERTEIEVTPLL